MGIGFPHDHLIADCGSRTKKGNREWGMGTGVKEVISQLPAPYAPLPHSPSSSAIIAKPGEFSLDSVAA